MIDDKKLRKYYIHFTISEIQEWSCLLPLGGCIWRWYFVLEKYSFYIVCSHIVICRFWRQHFCSQKSAFRCNSLCSLEFSFNYVYHARGYEVFSCSKCMALTTSVALTVEKLILHKPKKPNAWEVFQGVDKHSWNWLIHIHDNRSFTGYVIFEQIFFFNYSTFFSKGNISCPFVWYLGGSSNNYQKFLFPLQRSSKGIISLWSLRTKRAELTLEGHEGQGILNADVLSCGKVVR